MVITIDVRMMMMMIMMMPEITLIRSVKEVQSTYYVHNRDMNMLSELKVQAIGGD